MPYMYFINIIIYEILGGLGGGGVGGLGNADHHGKEVNSEGYRIVTV